MLAKSIKCYFDTKNIKELPEKAMRKITHFAIIAK